MGRDLSLHVGSAWELGIVAPRRRDHNGTAARSDECPVTIEPLGPGSVGTQPKSARKLFEHDPGLRLREGRSDTPPDAAAKREPGAR
jgi:hypothetical protein